MRKEADDILLLQLYTQMQDPKALEELISRYSKMVFNICYRITKNVDDAEDITQESFLEFADKAEKIKTSVAGWLHNLATHRAKNFIRSNSRRQYHELQSPNQKPLEENSWETIAQSLDQALEELPEKLRFPLIRHYFEGQQQEELGDELGVHQSTISRRLQHGLEELKKNLEKTGIVASQHSIHANLMTSNNFQMSAIAYTSLLKIPQILKWKQRRIFSPLCFASQNLSSIFMSSF